jgi:tripartite-type tricarboxylate transporter receptor subunit TctC
LTAAHGALWVGLFAPAGTSAAIVNRLDAQVSRILHMADTRRQLNAVGTDAFLLSQTAFVQRIKADAARYAVIVAKTGLSPPQQ